MKVILLDEAQHEFEAEDAWWREHRDAKDLFAEEFGRRFSKSLGYLRWVNATAGSAESSSSDGS